MFYLSCIVSSYRSSTFQLVLSCTVKCTRDPVYPGLVVVFYVMFVCRGALIKAGIVFKEDNSEMILYSLVDSDASDSEIDDDESWTDPDHTCDVTGSNLYKDTAESANNAESWDDPNDSASLHTIVPKHEHGQFSDADDSSDETDTVAQKQTGISSEVFQATHKMAEIDLQFSSTASRVNYRHKQATVSSSQTDSDVTDVSSSGISSQSDLDISSESPQLQSNLTAENAETLKRLAKAVIICRGCGCRMTQLIKGDNMCGLGDKCRTSFAGVFHNMQSSRLPPVALHDQFDDAD